MMLPFPKCFDHSSGGYSDDDSDSTRGKIVLRSFAVIVDVVIAAIIVIVDVIVVVDILATVRRS